MSNEINAKLVELAQAVLAQLEEERPPAIHIPQRGLSNVFFDDGERILRLGDKTSKRSFLNIAHTKKFMQTMLVAEYAKRLVADDKHAGIRELYMPSSTPSPSRRKTPLRTKTSQTSSSKTSSGRSPCFASS